MTDFTENWVWKNVTHCRNPSPISPSPVDTSNSTPRLNVEPPTPIITEPFRDYPDDEDEAERGGAPHEMLDQQQVIMDGRFTCRGGGFAVMRKSDA